MKKSKENIDFKVYDVANYTSKFVNFMTSAKRFTVILNELNGLGQSLEITKFIGCELNKLQTKLDYSSKKEKTYKGSFNYQYYKIGS